MGLFDRGKMNKKAGEWAAKAMGCMVYADGQGVGKAEITAAQGQVKTNRVLKDSIGSEDAEVMFRETLTAIGQVPAAMLPTYEAELAGLAKEIKDLNEKNFALATVIAVSMGDGTVTDSEYQMLLRFQKMLGATIPIPSPGQNMHAFEEAAVQKGAAEPSATPEDGVVSCASCNKPTKFYEGHGYWCEKCQEYAPGPPAEAKQEAAEVTSEVVEAKPATVNCSKCAKPTQLYEGHGHWCADCQLYTTP